MPAVGPAGLAPPAGSARPPPERARPAGDPAAPLPAAAGGGSLGKIIFVAGNALGALSARLYSKTRERGGALYEGFQGRPQHVRWRAYALAAYGAVLAATLAGQLYSTNKLGAYVRVQRVDIPATVEIFVRNDSRAAWDHVKLQLNGIYGYERARLSPGEYIQLKVEGFTLPNANGGVTRAPRNVHISQLTIDTDQGHFDLETDK
ncbi:MAG: hypothetical protein NVS4B10_24510 [Myxococcales bacterium]